MNLAPMDIITSRMDSILMEREGARTAQLAQAERMVKRSRIDIAHGLSSFTIAICISLDVVELGFSSIFTLSLVLGDIWIRCWCRGTCLLCFW